MQMPKLRHLPLDSSSTDSEFPPSFKPHLIIKSAEEWVRYARKEGLTCPSASMQDITVIAKTACAFFKIPEEHMPSVLESITPYKGVKINTPALYKMGLYLRANKAYLIKDEVILTPDTVTGLQDSWVPVIITSVVKDKNPKYESVMYDVKALVVASCMAGYSFTSKISGKYMKHIARNCGSGVYSKYVAPEELFGYHLTIVVGKGSDNALRIKKADTTPSQLDNNRKLHTGRSECSSSEPCDRCWKGVCHCRFAVKAASWMLKNPICPSCLSHDTLVMYEEDKWRCTSCEYKGTTKHDDQSGKTQTTRSV